MPGMITVVIGAEKWRTIKFGFLSLPLFLAFLSR